MLNSLIMVGFSEEMTFGQKYTGRGTDCKTLQMTPSSDAGGKEQWARSRLSKKEPWLGTSKR